MKVKQILCQKTQFWTARVLMQKGNWHQVMHHIKQ